MKNMCTYLVPNARVIVERLLVRGVCQGRADSRPGGLVYGCADPLHYVVAGRLAGTEICNLLAPCKRHIPSTPCVSVGTLTLAGESSASEARRASNFTAECTP